MIILQNEQGLHARPASLVVAEAKKYEADVQLVKDGKSYNAKSIMAVMSMEAKKGDTIEIKCTGADADLATENLLNVIGAL